MKMDKIKLKNMLREWYYLLGGLTLAVIAIAFCIILVELGEISPLIPIGIFIIFFAVGFSIDNYKNPEQ